MKGLIKTCSQTRHHVAIQTEDGDFAIVSVPTRELEPDDEVWGDFINPGPKTIRCANRSSVVAVYVEGCRLSPDAALEYLASLH